jgi:methyl-accepting chemotaxis protein
VSATIEGIETIRSLTRDARDVLEKLAERIGEIGEILTVIGGINEETNLLSRTPRSSPRRPASRRSRWWRTT